MVNNQLSKITKILLFLIILTCFVIVTTLLFFNAHLKRNGDIRKILQITEAIKDGVIADEDRVLYQSIKKLQKIYFKKKVIIFLSDSMPKDTILLNMYDVFLQPKVNKFIHHLNATNTISVSANLRHSKKWITAKSKRGYYWRDKESFYLMSFGLLLPTIILLALCFLYFLLRRKKFVEKLRLSFINMDAVSTKVESNSEQEGINELKEVVTKMLNQKTLLLSSISHDMNTSIFRLRLYLKDKNKNKEKMTQELNYLSDVIESSLLIAQTNRNEIQFEIIDLSGLLETFSQNFYQDKQQVTFLIPEKPVLIETNTIVIIRCLHNLVDNALKHAERAVVCVKVLHGLVYLICRDNGCGIPEEQIPRLLQPFEQMDKNQLGVGLGLAIISKLAEIQLATFTLRNSKYTGGLNALLIFKQASQKAPPD